MEGASIELIALPGVFRYSEFDAPFLLGQGVTFSFSREPKTPARG
jgi:hypothetical protein